MTNERKMVQDEEDAAIMAEAKKIAKEKGWLVASALAYMLAHTPKNAGEERFDRIAELQRRQHRYLTTKTEKRFQRLEREHDSMPLPDWIVRDDAEEMKKYR